MHQFGNVVTLKHHVIPPPPTFLCTSSPHGDVAVIDLSSRRVQSGGFRTLALKSLEKWRRLHTTPTLDDLVKTLRRLRKKDTIQRIQKEVMLASPVEKTRVKTHKWKHFYVAA